MTTLITMGAGNVKVLKETIKSLSIICDEVIYGDMLLWQEDRKVVESYKNEFNIKIVHLPFNELFLKGFSSILNTLASFSSNDICIYMNTSEIIGVDYGAFDIIRNNPECNTFFFTHAQENFRWFRCYNKNDFKWGGLIHEELIGEYNPYHKPIFQMADLEKDMDNEFKAKVLNDSKEIVYWNQLCRIVEDESLLSVTSPGWLEFAKSQYESMKERLKQKGERYECYKNGDLDGYIKCASDSKEFKTMQFKSNNAIAYQGDKIHLL